jgi:hypothetical protein
MLVKTARQLAHPALMLSRIIIFFQILYFDNADIKYRARILNVNTFHLYWTVMK